MSSWILKALMLWVFLSIVMISLTMFVEFIQLKKLHEKFIFLGHKDDPTEFIYKGKKVILYHERRYLRNEIKEYSSNLFTDTLYINKIPVITIECFEQTFHIQRGIIYNFDYDQEEIEAIIRQGVEEWHKQFEKKTSNKKSILNEENKNEEF